MNRKNIAQKIARSYIKRSKARWKEEGWEKDNPVEKARSYVGQRNIGFHYSEIGPDSHSGFKVGLNPMTDFNTPAGVYAYLANRENWDNHVSPHARGTSYADGRPWMYIVSYKDSNSVVHLDEGGSAGWSESELWMSLGRLYRKMPKWCQKVSKMRGEEVSKASEFKSTSWVRDGHRKAKHSTPFVKLWKNLEEMTKTQGGTTQWNVALRALDIEGVVDHGSGTVHDNEPYQCVMLKGTLVRMETVVPNLQQWWSDKQEREVQEGVSTLMFETSIDEKAKEHNIDGTGFRQVLENTLNIRSLKRDAREEGDVKKKVQKRGRSIASFLDKNERIYDLLSTLDDQDVLDKTKIHYKGGGKVLVRNGDISDIDNLREWGLWGFRTSTCSFRKCSLEGSYDGSATKSTFRSTKMLSHCTLSISSSDLEKAASDIIEDVPIAVGLFEDQLKSSSPSELVDVFKASVGMKVEDLKDGLDAFTEAVGKTFLDKCFGVHFGDKFVVVNCDLKVA
jgi:hypothetical protein